MSTQSQIDSISYPPTHTYEFAGTNPTGILAQRVEIIELLAPELFTGSSFLDVGANKGYFSLRASRAFDHVLAIEPMRSCCDLLRSILPDNCDLLCGTFGDMWENEQFDSIFIGNGHHYPYRESGGWGWVDKLAKISSGTVVLEGPTGMECQDMHLTFQDPELHAEFNWDSMQAAFEPYFEFMGKVPTVGYTPDRYIIHYERKHG